MVKEKKPVHKVRSGLSKAPAITNVFLKSYNFRGIENFVGVKLKTICARRLHPKSSRTCRYRFCIESPPMLISSRWVRSVLSYQ